MTLLVYSNGVMYADNRVVVEMGHSTSRYVTDTKIYISERKQIALGICGTIPHIDDLQLILSLFEAMVRVHEQLGRSVSKDSEKVADIFGGILDHVIIISRTGLYNFLPTFKSLHIQHDICLGSGANIFSLCRLHGMSVRQAYAKTRELVSDVGELTNIVRQRDLLVIPKGKASKTQK